MKELIDEGLAKKYLCRHCLGENLLFKQADGTFTPLLGHALSSHFEKAKSLKVKDQLKREE